ncbi:MAG: hypothetical protein FJ031_08650 [Chloroflexi bacterium]|nr:hypothetical protein [Chloroflexota bacterium]
MKYASTAQDGDLAQLVGLTHKHFIITLKEGGDFQSHRGVIKHEELIGKPWGSQVFSHTGAPFYYCSPRFPTCLTNCRAPRKFCIRKTSAIFSFKWESPRGKP